jgi:predicted nucleotidyltransferase
MNTSALFDEIANSVSIHHDKILGCYLFGSVVYGTANEDSDWDVMLIADGDTDEIEYVIGNFNIHRITPRVFEELVRLNHIKAVECLYAPQWAQLKAYPITFEFNPMFFRQSVSHTVSNSWVKCKKKLEQGDYYIGIKSLFHSLRIASFGIQFSMKREIQFDYCNIYWRELSEKEWNWEELKEKYQPIKNALLTVFRENCRK